MGVYFVGRKFWWGWLFHVANLIPVHPGYRIFGQDIRCGTSGNGGCVYEHDSSKDLTFDSSRPFGTATGDNIRDTYKVIC